MVCALTARKLKPGTFEQFHGAFMRFEDPEDQPAGWVRFNMLRSADDPDQVISFGFFDGTVEEARRSSSEGGYSELVEALAPFVDSVGADGMYEVVEEWTAAPDTAA